MKDILKIPSNKQVWFTSDTHFGHTNICLGTSTWENKESKCRNFNSLEKMNNYIVATINDCVGENDILIHLCDWSFLQKMLLDVTKLLPNGDVEINIKIVV